MVYSNGLKKLKEREDERKPAPSQWGVLYISNRGDLLVCNRK